VSGEVTISTASVAGTISGANSVTSGTNSTLLTLSGHTGSVQWQSSANGTSFSNATGTSTNATYTATNLSATTYYRAVVTNGGCPSVNSPSATILVSPAPVSGTTMNITGTGTTISVTNNVATVVDGALNVTGTGTFSGFSVSITENYTSGDILDYTGALPSGVTAAPFNTTSRSLVFTGSAGTADWQALLRTVRLKTSAVTCNPETRRITFSASTNFYNYFNGHYYEYYPTVQSWTSAKAFAASKTFFGRQGYLVTISSAAENAFVSSLINHDTWIGCSDNAGQINGAVGYTKYSSQSNAEGRWHWITGPEKGVQIRTGNASTAEKPGSGVSGVYQNWNLGGQYANNEPNDVWGFGTPGQEDYGHLWANSGKWNDFPNNGRACIIEYGDMPGDNPTGTLDYSRSVLVLGSTSGNISGGTTVCSGDNATLTLNGSSGSVARWESSPDNFLITGNIQTISNTTNSLGLSNLSTTAYYRAIMVQGACTLATNSQTVAVTEINAGAVTANSNQVCANSNAQLTLGGYTGAVQKWQRATDTTSTITDIASTSASLSNLLTSAGTYYFRCQVGSATCSTAAKLTGWYPVNVVAGGAPTGGTVSTNYHCGVNNSGVLQLTGSTGATYQWQRSTDGGTTWNNISSATQPAYSYQNITTNTKFRVNVSNGACGSATSSVGAVELYGTNICQWTGAVNSSWTNSGNWCAGIAADAGRAMDVSADAANEPVLDMDRTVGTLTFNFGSKKINLGNFNLTVSQIVGADSLNYVKTAGTGRLKANIPGSSGLFTFAVGRSSYNPVTITNKNVDSDVFSVRVFDEVLENGTSGSPIQTPHVQRTWDIDKTNPANTGGVDFEFGWRMLQQSAAMSGYFLNHYEAGSGWQLPAVTTINQTAVVLDSIKTLPFYGYTGTFSPFAIGGSGVSPLPVKLISFDVTCEEGMPRFEWTTASEINNSHFDLEQSADLITWEKAARIEGNGNSNQLTDYTYTLEEFRESRGRYFRLHQYDYNGDSEAHPSVHLGGECEAGGIQPILYPNPNKGIAWLSGSRAGAEWELIDLRGTVLAKFRADASGRLAIQFTGDAGMYIIRTNEGGSVRSVLFVKE
jgi:hypothetical protein